MTGRSLRSQRWWRRLHRRHDQNGNDDIDLQLEVVVVFFCLFSGGQQLCMEGVGQVLCAQCCAHWGGTEASVAVERGESVVFLRVRQRFFETCVQLLKLERGKSSFDAHNGSGVRLVDSPK